MKERSYRRLFLDNEHVSRMEKVRRVVNRPEPVQDNPVLEPERPWEMGGISTGGRVLYDETEARFKYWYQCRAGDPREMVTMDGKEWLSNRCLLCYATSEDGIHWDRPEVGQVDFEGSKANNILRIGRANPEGVGIEYDPDDPDADRRYKAFFWEHGAGGIDRRADGLILWADAEGDGMWVAFSRDGIHWKNYEKNPVIGGFSDTAHYVVRDPRTGRYAAYGRLSFLRTVARAESEDFVHWNAPRLVLEPDEHEAAGPYPDTQFYGMTVQVYEGVCIGGLWVYREGTDGRIDTQLTVSADGIHWTRVGDRETFLPLAPEGNRGDGMVRSVGFVPRGKRIYVYYQMTDGPHAGPKFPRGSIVRRYPGAIGLGLLRRDGFVSLDAGDEEGYILSKPFVMQGKPLHVNARVEPRGEMTASVKTGHALDPNAPASITDVEGFECSEPIAGDSTDRRVHWAGDRALSELAGKVCRLRFKLRKAKFYSFWFE